MTLRAGVAKAIITPPVGTALEGYSARADVSQGVHDDLYARALVLDDGETSVALVACDLVGVDRRLVAEAREQASAATGIPGERMMIAATHTHAGPAGLRRDVDDALLDVTARTIAGAIAEAYRGRREAVLKLGSTTVDSVAQNRRHPEWPVDTGLHVLLFDDPDPLRPPIAAVLNFACHPTVLYHTTLEVSADYPGAAMRTVERLFPGVGGVFFNGACGNVNPNWIEQRFEETERVGTIVGAAAARIIAELRPLGTGQQAHNIRWDEHLDWPVTAGELVGDVRLRVASRRVELPVKQYLAMEEYESTLRELEARASGGERDERRRAMEQITRLRSERAAATRMASRTAPVHPELWALSIAPGLALLGLPGEWFVESIANIRERAGLRHLPVACYANHYIGYVVPAEAYEQGGYEPGVSLLAPEAEAIACREAVDLLREVTS